MRVTKLKPGCSTMVEIQREKVGCILATPSLNSLHFPTLKLSFIQIIRLKLEGHF